MHEMDNRNPSNIDLSPIDLSTIDVPPGIVRAEVVEVAPSAPWQWREVRAVQPRHRWGLAIGLFVATCLSTTFVAMSDATSWWSMVASGLRYSIPVMTILLCHEMGHFLQAKRYGVYASLPYFIPFPLSPLGTFGAVIAMEPRVGGRRALFDIGISGPLAGLVPTFYFLIVGLQQSQYVAAPASGIGYGQPLLVQYLAASMLGPRPVGSVIDFSPMAFAGWVGLLITSLNLIPIGQLDGGHVLYALLRRRAHQVGRLLLLAALILVVLNFHTLGGWVLMLFLLFLMGPIHPPTADDDEPLGLWRTILGWLTLAFIFIGFTPTPIVFPD